LVKAMAQELLFPTVLKSSGPWLIGSKDVLALDEIFDQIIASTSASDSDRSLKIFLSKDRELKTSSFKEAMSHVGSQDELATGFRYEVTTKNGSASVRLVPPTKREKDEGEHSPVLTVKNGPTGSSASQSIIWLIKTWASDVQPPRWRRWLLAPRSLMRLSLGLVAVIGSLILFSTTPAPSDYKETYKRQAHELLKNGIDERNQAKATEVLLALQSDYIPPGAKAKHSQRSFVIFAVTVLVLAV